MWEWDGGSPRWEAMCLDWLDLAYRQGSWDACYLLPILQPKVTLVTLALQDLVKTGIKVPDWCFI